MIIGIEYIFKINSIGNEIKINRYLSILSLKLKFMNLKLNNLTLDISK